MQVREGRWLCKSPSFLFPLTASYSGLGGEGGGPRNPVPRGKAINKSSRGVSGHGGLWKEDEATLSLGVPGHLMGQCKTRFQKELGAPPPISEPQALSWTLLLYTALTPGGLSCRCSQHFPSLEFGLSNYSLSVSVNICHGPHCHLPPSPHLHTQVILQSLTVTSVSHFVSQATCYRRPLH